MVNTRHMSPQNSTLLRTVFFHHSHTVGIAVEAAALSHLVNLHTSIIIITLKAAAQNFPSLEASTSSVVEVVPVKWLEGNRNKKHPSTVLPTQTMIV